MNAPATHTLTLADRLRVRASAGWGVVINPDEARQIARLFDKLDRAEAMHDRCVEARVAAAEFRALGDAAVEAARLETRKQLLFLGLALGVYVQALLT